MCRAILMLQIIEAVRSRFDSGHWLPWDVRVLFKTHKFCVKICIGKSTSVVLTPQIPAWVLRLATFVAGRSVREGRVRGSCENGYRLANRVTYVCGAAHFNQSSSTMCSGESSLILNSGNAWLRKTRKCYPLDSVLGVSRQRAGCVCTLVEQ